MTREAAGAHSEPDLYENQVNELFEQLLSAAYCYSPWNNGEKYWPTPTTTGGMTQIGGTHELLVGRL